MFQNTVNFFILYIGKMWLNLIFLFLTKCLPILPASGESRLTTGIATRVDGEEARNQWLQLHHDHPIIRD